MPTRTTQKTVTFKKPFFLDNFNEKLPAGDYIVETDEDLLQGISFSAYIRVSTIIYLPGTQKKANLKRALTIKPEDLEAALLRDQKTSKEFLSQFEIPSSDDLLAIDEAENEGMKDLR